MVVESIGGSIVGPQRLMQARPDDYTVMINNIGMAASASRARREVTIRRSSLSAVRRRSARPRKEGYRRAAPPPIRSRRPKAARSPSTTGKAAAQSAAITQKPSPPSRA